MRLLVDEAGEQLLGVAEDQRPGEIWAEVSRALRPGTNWPCMSSRPRKAVTAPMAA